MIFLGNTFFNSVYFRIHMDTLRLVEVFHEAKSKFSEGFEEMHQNSSKTHFASPDQLGLLCATVTGYK